MAPRRLALVGMVAVVLFAFDRLTKTWVEQNIPLNEARPVIDDYVRIVHTQNTGAAFGLLPERTTLLSVLSVIAVIAILYYYRQIASASLLVAATLGHTLPPSAGIARRLRRFSRRRTPVLLASPVSSKMIATARRS